MVLLRIIGCRSFYNCRLLFRPGIHQAVIWVAVKQGYCYQAKTCKYTKAHAMARWATYRHGGRDHVGVVSDDTIHAIAEDVRLIDLIARGADGLRAAAEAAMGVEG